MKIFAQRLLNKLKAMKKKEIFWRNFKLKTQKKNKT